MSTRGWRSFPALQPIPCAQGMKMGTRFIATREASVHENVKAAGVYPRIIQEGDVDAGAWSCGMVAGLIHDIPTCKELIDMIMSGAEEIINQRLSGFLNA
jgi:NAD(P)H-dependent flavin oxidoreductase YrpB (nitropropane dioxygenase family)